MGENFVTTSSYTSFEAAAIAANTQNVTLIIDSNTNATQVNSSIEVGVTVRVYNGARIITPGVVRSMDGNSPIAGTVAQNYVQINFNKDFHADNVQVFEGDGIIFFRNNSVAQVKAIWYGIIFANNSVTPSYSVMLNNWHALQKAVNTIVLDKSNNCATKKLLLPNGNIFLEQPIVGYACPLATHPYYTGSRATAPSQACIIHLSGAERIKHGINYKNTTNIYYKGTYGAAFIFQGLRNTSIKNIYTEGNNYYRNRDTQWMPAGGYGLVDNNDWATFLRPLEYWIDTNIKWDGRKPYAFVITDPFAYPTSDYRSSYQLTSVPESTIDLYYAATSVGNQNSWDVIMSGIHCQNYVSLHCNTLTGQQGDTYVYEDIMVQKQPFGLSICQDQSRACVVKRFLAYDDVYCAFEGNIHGERIGVCPQIDGFEAYGALKYVIQGFAFERGAVMLENAYCELLYAIGTNGDETDYFDGGVGNYNNEVGAGQFPSYISNSTFKLQYCKRYTTNNGTEDNYLYQRPVIRKFNIENTFIGIYGTVEQQLYTTQFYEHCHFGSGVSHGVNAPIYYPIDMKWFTHRMQDSNYRTPKISGNATYQNTGYSSPLTNNIDRLISANSKNDRYKQLNWDLSDATTYELTSNTQLSHGRVYPMRGYIEVDTSLGSPYPLEWMRSGMLVDVSKTGTLCRGVVESVNLTTGLMRIINIQKSKLDTMYSKSVDGELTSFSVNFIRYTPSHKPFKATSLGNSKLLTVTEVLLNQPATSNPVTRLMTLRMPNGELRWVADSVGTQITLNANYAPALNGSEIFLPYRPNFETTILTDSRINASLVWDNGIYEKGKRYNYEFSSKLTTDYLICTKTGLFDSNNNLDKACFLRYSLNNSLIDYLDGTNSNSTQIPIKKIPFNISGITANRPDNLGIPLDIIPVRYLYKNTETATTQIYDGTSFIDL